MTTRKELIGALRARYRAAEVADKVKILDEFVALTGYHRKHAIRVLREEATSKETRARNRLYDEAVRQALTVLWEAADRVCGKRLKALIPMLVDAMERHGHLDLDPVVKTKVLQVSAATIDRVLADARAHIDGKRRRRTGVGAAIQRSIPVRTFADWRDPVPGFLEIDMVEHCGGSQTGGDYVHTLTLTDIASGWTECVAMRVRDQMLVIDAFEKVAADLPFAMLGIDSDNDSTFMSQAVFDYCKGRKLEQTRSRAYKKNDQAWVEQKNGAVVRAPGRLWPPEWARSHQGSGATLRIVALVHQLLPTLVQAEIQDTRRRARAQGLLRAGDPMREACCPQRRRAFDQREADGAIQTARPCAAAAGNPDGTADVEPHRDSRHADRGVAVKCPRCCNVPPELVGSLERRRSAPDAPQAAQGQTRVENPTGSVRRRLARH